MAVSGTLVKRIMVKITADDMDADEKMDAISAKADELAEKHPELKVKIDSAAAMAKMKVLRDEIKAATATPVDLDPALQAAADERVKSMQENLQQLAERADKFRESVDGDKEAMANLLSLNAGLEHMKENLSDPAMSPASMASAEAQLARFDAQLDKLRAGLEAPAGPSQSFSALWTDPAAVTRLSALQAQIEAMSAKAQDIKFKGDDRELELTLTRLKLQLDEMSDKIIDPKFEIRGIARAEADLTGIDIQMDKLKAKADASDSEGLLGRILVGRGGSGSGFLGGLVKWLPFLGEGASSGIGGIGNIGTEGGEGAAGGGPEGLATAAGMLGAIVDAAAAASTEITGVVSGFAAAGVGAGAFALLAYPAVKQVTGALGDTKAQLEKLPKPEQAAVLGIKGLQGEWQKMSTAFQPEAFKVFSGFLQIANNLLPAVTPLATAFAGSLDGLLQKASTFTESKGFKEWLGQFEKLVGPSTTAIGSGIGNVTGNLGKLLTLMSSKDDVNAINIAFSVIDGTLVTFIGFVHYSMVVWDALTTAWDTSVDAIRRGGHYMAEGFDVARHAAATFGHDTAGAFDTARHAAATGGHDVATGFDTARHGAATAGDAIEKQTDRTGSFVRTHWKDIAGWIVSPIGMAVLTIRTHTHQIATDFDTMRHDVAGTLAGLRHDVATDFDGIRHSIAHDLDGARHDVAQWTDNVVTFFGQLPGRTVHALAQWAGDLFHSGDTSVKSMGRGAETGAAPVWSFFERLPGKVLGFLARLPGEMLSAGRNVIDGLIHGIEQGAADIPGLMKSLAGEVESYFTDPLKIFSPSRVMYQHGLMVPEGVALGIEAGSPRIRQAAAGMARAVSGTALGAHGTATGTAAAGSHITIQISGDAALRQWLKKSIRVTGGNVQVVGA